MKTIDTRPPAAEAASGQAFSGNPAGALGAAAHSLVLHLLIEMHCKMQKCNYI